MTCDPTPGSKRGRRAPRGRPTARGIARWALLLSSQLTLHTLSARPSTAQDTAQDAAAPAAALRQDVRRYRTAHEPAIIREFATLLAVPNVASDHANIRRNANLLLAMLQRRGLTARLLEEPNASPAVFGQLTVPGATRTVLIYAHYDGQPVVPAQWATPPWSPTLRTGPLSQGGVVIPLPADSTSRVSGTDRLYARSAGDDKASIIAILTVLDALRAAHRAPSVNVKLLFEGEEEAGSTHLAEILSHNATLLSADVLLLGDGPEHQSGEQQLLLGVRGVTSLELTLYGATRPLHSGHYGNWAPNAGVMLANVIASMRDDDGHIRIAGFYDDVRPPSPAELRAVAAVPPIDSALRRSLGLARTEANDAPLAERLMLPALNLRGLSFGSVGAHAANVISTEARASFDFRLVPDQTPDRVHELVNAHLRTLGYFVTADSVTMAMRLAHARIARVQWERGGYPASRTDMNLPVVHAVIRAVTGAIGTRPIVLPTMGASTPNYMFEQALHLPVIIVPIANYDDNQHAANENLRLQNLWDGIELYAGVLTGLGAR